MDKIEEMNQLKLKGLDNIRCGDAMNTLLLPHRNKRYSIIKQLLLIVKYSFYKRSVVNDVNEKAEKAFIFSNSYGSRKDYIPTFNKVVSTCDSRIVFRPGKSFNPRYCYLITYVFQWYRQVRKIFDLNKTWSLLSELYIAYIESRFILYNINKYKCNAVVVFCDFHLVDSLVIQMCNNLGINTITLQHGHFSEGSIAFKYSHSKYFLGYGDYTLNAAIKTGYDRKRFIKVGMPQLIDVEVSNLVIHHSTNNIIVILDGLAKEDIDLLDLTNIFSKKYGYNRIIKLHPGHGFLPTYKGHIFEKDIVYLNEKSVVDLIREADFSLVAGGSTTFFEYLVRLYPVFAFSKHNNRLPEFEWCSFKTEEELFELYIRNQQGELDNMFINARKRISETIEIRQKYSEFFGRDNKI